MSKKPTIGTIFALLIGFTATSYAQTVGSLAHWEYHLLSEFSQLAALEAMNTKSQKPRDNMPPLDSEKVTKEFLLGGLLGLSGAAFMGYSGETLDLIILDNQSDVIGLGPFVGASAGYIIGAATGVYVIGDTGNETGSFLASILGATAGIGTFLGLLRAMDIIGVEMKYAEDIGQLALLVAPSLGATIGFNLTRRYRIPFSETTTALINFVDGRVCIAVPSIYSRSELRAGALSQRVDVLKIRF